MNASTAPGDDRKTDGTYREERRGPNEARKKERKIIIKKKRTKQGIVHM